MGLFLKLDILTLNNTIYSNCIQLHLGEILVSLEVVLSKKAEKSRKMAVFAQFSVKQPL